MYFNEALTWLFSNLNTTLEVTLFNVSKINELGKDKDDNSGNSKSDDSFKIDTDLDFNPDEITNGNDNYKGNNFNDKFNNNFNDRNIQINKKPQQVNYNNNNITSDLNFTFNKDKQDCINKLLLQDQTLFKEVVNSLFSYTTSIGNDYILDRNDNYILVKLIKNYIFSDENPVTSNLMISYNIYSSSLELIFCLKLVELYPIPIFCNANEQKYYIEYMFDVKYKINVFINSWVKIYKTKYENNKLIMHLLANNIKSTFEAPLDIKSLTKYEPNLPIKLVSFTKLIKDGIFSFEIEEIARQLCIIDQQNIKNISLYEIHNYIKKSGKTKLFDKIRLREKHIKCYILLVILIQNSLENKKLMTENFIFLASGCKLLHNYQSSYTIIATFHLVGLTSKKLLWRQIEKKYRDLYLSLEKDYLEVELKEFFLKDKEKVVFPCIPNFMNIYQKTEYFINQLNEGDSTKIFLSKEYKDYNVMMNEISNIKYPFFKVNPLYDFLKFGFLEIFKAKKWNLKLNLDFSKYIEQPKLIDSLLDILVSNFKKVG